MVEPQPSSGSAEARAWSTGRPSASTETPAAAPRPAANASSGLASTAAALPLSPATSDTGVVLAPSTDETWLGREHRRQERHPVQASRPIAARLHDADGRPQGRWFLADILDISCGGLCLLVSGAIQLPSDQRLELDVRCHPDFGTLRLECLVRWCRSSIGFTTLGLAFREPLPRLPRLEIERRSTRRDPNDEAWAKE